MKLNMNQPGICCGRTPSTPSQMRATIWRGTAYIPPPFSTPLLLSPLLPLPLFLLSPLDSPSPLSPPNPPPSTASGISPNPSATAPPYRQQKPLPIGRGLGLEPPVRLAELAPKPKPPPPQILRAQSPQPPRLGSGGRPVILSSRPQVSPPPKYTPRGGQKTPSGTPLGSPQKASSAAKPHGSTDSEQKKRKTTDAQKPCPKSFKKQ